ncbi:bifunctional DNA-formamidopyrimidine glycosylase/DNA-(apurinic or apyrimidinic site) lyase [Nitrincola nitratireducens]|uniref:Formamidopyrimidine-DNA glycosylase n=1 Tax=Nitrincola nitratireducens TaxID=1229521 RepID=W9UTN9_9GAMM|nr:bifunctional DNA-formamidopyrimidine glycosylase/DNA-(apurinic or apyrimidinic site) lyase [Nitrincola nitratireducens]EXJ10444.1 Formamidopyrimidine-DNA glycosylase [Nitrincola nitratireducens]
MPELPEVETTRRGIEPHILHHSVEKVVIRQPKLRWPVPDNLANLIEHQLIEGVFRRGKYLLIDVGQGVILIHLGMSGSLRIVEQGTPVAKHDHADFCLSSGRLMRFTDPRRFGAILWQAKNEMHPLLARLGPEPLTEAFNAQSLFLKCQGRTQAIKTFLMDSQVVVGVGNIYANEALFAANIDPQKAAGLLSIQEIERLTQEVKRILTYAVERGGTTLRDFVGGDGKPGYFQQELYVYGRKGLPCKVCKNILVEVRMGQRSTVFCKVCQH